MPDVVSTSEPVRNLLEEAYLIKDGDGEFDRLHGIHGRNFSKQCSMFRSASTRAYSEFPLGMFRNWFDRLVPLKDIIKYPVSKTCKDEDSWKYFVILLYPKNVPKSPAATKTMHWAVQLAQNFYKDLFAGIPDAQCIDLCVLSFPTIMIVGCPAPAGAAERKTIAFFESAVVISAITFYQAEGDQCGSSLIPWLGVAGVSEEAARPSCISSWRRLGLGRLMLIMVIKRLTMDLLRFLDSVPQSCSSALPGVDIYLQCSQPQAKAFYEACGFVRINDPDDNGINLLPNTLFEPGEESDNFAFAWVESADDERQVALLRLRSGCLCNSFVDPEPEVQVLRTVPGKEPTLTFAQYPSSTILPSAGASGALLSNSDLEALYAGLNLVDELVPPPTDVLVPPAKLRMKGEIQLQSRWDHGQAKGKSWMGTGELEMMLALLMKDGRYEASVSIISISQADCIKKCFEAFSDYYYRWDKVRKDLWNAKELELREAAALKFPAEEENEAKVPIPVQKQREALVDKGMRDFAPSIIEALHNRFLGPQKKIWDRYSYQMNQIVKRVVLANQGIMQKKIIVFPVNINNAHWGLVFVFNPGSIELEPSSPSDMEFSYEKSAGLRCCFFRCCSGDASGNRGFSINHGIKWFLNLAFSHEARQKAIDSDPTNKKFVMQFPFGKELMGPMIGTERFPALRLFDHELYLPQQGPNDNYNCGIGMVSIIGIMLRELIGADSVEDCTQFFTTFSNPAMPIELVPHKIATSTREAIKEYACALPRGLLKPLPHPECGSYLHAAKAQWFVLFDRLAELQNVTLPRRLNPDHVPHPRYEAFKRDVLALTWPKELPKESARTSVPAEPGKKSSEGNESPPPLISDSDGKADDSNKENEPGSDAQKATRNDGDKTNDGDETKDGGGEGNKENGPGGDAQKATGDDGDKTKDGGGEGNKENGPGGDALKATGNDGDGDKTKERGGEDNGEKRDDQGDNELPPATKQWKGGRPSRFAARHIPTDYKEGIVSEDRFKPFVRENDVSTFISTHCKKEDINKVQPVVSRDEVSMNKFVNDAFVNWGWPSNSDFKNQLEQLHRDMLSAMQRSKKKKRKEEYRIYYEAQIATKRKERRLHRRNFELEWMFGTAAMVHGMKYNPREDTFTARMLYSSKTSEGTVTTNEEIVTVSHEWIKAADYAPGAIQHVINLGNTDGFVPIDSAKEVLINTKKVYSLRYIKPVTLWVRGKAVKGKKRNMCPTEVPGYWEVKFYGETKALKVDEAFVGNFKRRFLDEVKRLDTKGFVPIPVGDFKPSHLHEHPNLLDPRAPYVHFVQSEGEDLCVSKSFASALYAISFPRVAQLVNDYGEQELRGGTVDAIGKVGDFAVTKLPKWVTRRVVQRCQYFQWDLLQEQMKRTIALVVLNESDGNGSHSVTIHGGYIYDANEARGIPLCKEGLDYCCSTSTTKNEFVNFRKVTLFYYEGIDSKRNSSLTLDTNRKRKDREEEEEKDRSKRIVRTSYIFL